MDRTLHMHMHTFTQIMSASNCDDNPIRCLYTDGGPDHNNNTFLATKLALISIFIEKDLDMLVAVRTPPYHSWKNPVERVMSIVNIALQGIGLMRSPMSEKQEKEISSCNSVKSIREVCESNGELQAELADSIQSTKCLLETLLSRLKLKDIPFQVFRAASAVDTWTLSGITCSKSSHS